MRIYLFIYLLKKINKYNFIENLPVHVIKTVQ